jgi:hypothetical protein
MRLHNLQLVDFCKVDIGFQLQGCHFGLEFKFEKLVYIVDEIKYMY